MCSEDSAEWLVPSKSSALNLASAVSKPNITKNEKLAKGKAFFDSMCCDYRSV